MINNSHSLRLIRKSLMINSSKEYLANKNLKVGIIDSGIDGNLKALNLSKINGRSYIDNSMGLTDELGHGTQILGIINSMISNFSLNSYKVFNSFYGNSYHVINAIYDAIRDGNEIINISFGNYQLNSKDNVIVQQFNNAINYGIETGVIFTCSNGNEGINFQYSNYIHLPSSLKGVISASASTKDLNIADYSNYEKYNISAIGGELVFNEVNEIEKNKMVLSLRSSMSTYSEDLIYNNELVYTYGTSISSAYITALIIKLKTQYPSKSTEFYYNKLLSNSSQIFNKDSLFENVSFK